MACLSDRLAQANANADLDRVLVCDGCGEPTEDQSHPWRGLCARCQADSLNEPPADFAPEVEVPDREC